MAKENKVSEASVQEAKKQICGIVMPISSIDNCTENHWKEVKGIISDELDLKPDLSVRQMTAVLYKSALFKTFIIMTL